MNLSGNIRVKTEKKYKYIYNEFKNIFKREFHELFFISACIGYKKRKKQELEGGGDDRFWSGTITPQEYCCYYAMVLKDNDMEVESIKEDKKILEIIEKYSNSGMKVLFDELLNDYLISKDDFRIDFSEKGKLPRDFFQYLYQLI